MSQKEKKVYKELANKLSVAYGAFSIGVSSAHFEKTYHDPDCVGEFWYNLAKNLDERLRQSINRKIGT